MQCIHRHFNSLITEYLELFPCIALVGVRQSGKTTLLKQLPDAWKYYDLEKASDLDIISNDPDLFFRLNTHRVAIDEAQLLPDLFPALRVAIDSERNTPGRFVITGSSSPQLLHSISESLAGRVAIIEISPFSIAEAFSKEVSPVYDLIAKGAPIEVIANIPARHSLQEIHKYWLKGGYPEPWLKNNERFSELWFQNYQQTYINRDIIHLFPNLDLQKYRLFIRLLSNLSGKIINYSEIARVIGVSQPTAREYLRIANGTFMWRHIPAFDRNIGKRLVKHPKGYLRDSGMLHHMLHIHSTDDLLAHPTMGSSWESMIIENIFRNFEALGIQHDYSHYRTGGGAEIDLILEGRFGTIPIEIKYGQKVNQKNLKAINTFIEEYLCPYGIVVNNDERPRLYNDKLIGLPATRL